MSIPRSFFLGKLELTCHWASVSVSAKPRATVRLPPAHSLTRTHHGHSTCRYTLRTAAVSVTSAGFMICATPAFEVVTSVPPANSSGPCLVSSGAGGESCLYDRNYGNDERCTAKVTLNEIQIDTVQFDTEQGYDFLSINGKQYSGITGPNQVSVPDNTVISWTSDYSNTGGGWEVCANLESPCAATCNSDGSVNLPAVQFSELLVAYGQPGNYQAPAPQMHNSCCGANGGFCGTNKLFQDDQCRTLLPSPCCVSIRPVWSVDCTV
jgi:hypothetical protein